MRGWRTQPREQCIHTGSRCHSPLVGARFVDIIGQSRSLRPAWRTDQEEQPRMRTKKYQQRSTTSTRDATNFAIAGDIRCIERVHVPSKTRVDSALAKHTHYEGQGLRWSSVKERTPVFRCNTDRSSEIPNVIAVESLLLYNCDGRSGSCSYHREPSEAVCHDNDDGAMVIRRKCLQRRKRVRRHDVWPGLSRRIADESAIQRTCMRVTRPAISCSS